MNHPAQMAEYRLRDAGPFGRKYTALHKFTLSRASILGLAKTDKIIHKGAYRMMFAFCTVMPSIQRKD